MSEPQDTVLSIFSFRHLYPLDFLVRQSYTNFWYDENETELCWKNQSLYWSPTPDGAIGSCTVCYKKTLENVTDSFLRKQRRGVKVETVSEWTLSCDTLSTSRLTDDPSCDTSRRHEHLSFSVSRPFTVEDILIDVVLDLYTSSLLCPDLYVSL